MVDVDATLIAAGSDDKDGDPVTLEARHRARARLEDRIRIAKTTDAQAAPARRRPHRTPLPTDRFHGHPSSAKPGELQYQLAIGRSRLSRKPVPNPFLDVVGSVRVMYTVTSPFVDTI